MRPIIDPDMLEKKSDRKLIQIAQGWPVPKSPRIVALNYYVFKRLAHNCNALYRWIHHHLGGDYRCAFTWVKLFIDLAKSVS